LTALPHAERIDHHLRAFAQRRAWGRLVVEIKAGVPSMITVETTEKLDAPNRVLDTPTKP